MINQLNITIFNSNGDGEGFIVDKKRKYKILIKNNKIKKIFLFKNGEWVESKSKVLIKKFQNLLIKKEEERRKKEEKRIKRKEEKIKKKEKKLKKRKN